MGKRLLVLATLTIVVLAIEVLFLHSYNQSESFVVDYSSLAGGIDLVGNTSSVAGVSVERPLSFNQEYPDPNKINWDEVASVIPQPPTSGSANLNTNMAINPQTQNSNNLPQPVIPVTPSPSGSFAAQADYSIDFSKIANGTPVSNYFRIQNGADDHWDPSWNNEKQVYRANNVKIENGNLVLEARLETNGEISAGKVDTQGFFNAKYGKFEVTAKFPAGIGTFPAIWMLSASSPNFRDNIANAAEKALDISWQGDGEIDIIEFLGAEPGYIYHDAHTFRTLVNNSDPYSKTTKLNSVTTAYHVYGVEWTPEAISYTVDGVKTATIKKAGDDIRDWPFNTPFYLILNLAMGGDWNDSLAKSKPFAGTKGINYADQANWKFYISSIKHYPLL